MNKDHHPDALPVALLTVHVCVGVLGWVFTVTE